MDVKVKWSFGHSPVSFNAIARGDPLRIGYVDEPHID